MWRRKFQAVDYFDGSFEVSDIELLFGLAMNERKDVTGTVKSFAWLV